MQHDEARVSACTSADFQGFVTMIKPGAFVSRFCGLDKRKPGCYALTVQGSIPDHIINESEFERESELEERLSRRSSERAAPTPRSVAGKTPRQHDTEDDFSLDSDEEPLQGKKGTEKAPAFAETSPVTEVVGTGAVTPAESRLDGNLEAELFGEVSSEEQEATPGGTPAKRPREEVAEPQSDTKSFGELFSPDQSPAEHADKKRRVDFPDVLEKEGDTEFK